MGNLFRLFWSKKSSNVRPKSSDVPTDLETPSAPLSIHPDPKYYIQSNTNPYGRVQRVIDMSDGGVLGVTGERGAGKSVLLNKLIDDYSGKYLTVNLAAPISSSREMEFFVTLFRHLTQRVINELRSRAKKNREDIESLGRAAIGQDRSRNLVVILTIATLFFVIFGSFYQWEVLQRKEAYYQSQIAELKLQGDQAVQRRLELVQDDLERMETEKAAASIKKHHPAQGDANETDSRIKDLQQDVSDLQSGKSRISLTFQKRIDAIQGALTDLQNSKWPWLSQEELRVVLTVLMGIAVAVTAMIILPFFRSLGFHLNITERGLLIYSERLARRLDYELTRSSEQGFELSPASWIKGSAKMSRQEISRALSLPELTTSYIEFVSNLLRVFKGKLLICTAVRLMSR